MCEPVPDWAVLALRYVDARLRDLEARCAKYVDDLNSELSELSRRLDALELAQTPWYSGVPILADMLGGFRGVARPRTSRA